LDSILQTFYTIDYYSSNALLSLLFVAQNLITWSLQSLTGQVLRHASLFINLYNLPFQNHFSRFVPYITWRYLILESLIWRILTQFKKSVKTMKEDDEQWRKREWGKWSSHRCLSNFCGVLLCLIDIQNSASLLYFLASCCWSSC
jgi:hypothetical protein